MHYFKPEDYYDDRGERFRPILPHDPDLWKHGAQVRREGMEAAHVRRVLRPVDMWASDADLCALATARAEYMLDWVIGLGVPVTLDLINDQLGRLEARPMEYQTGAKAKPVEVQLQAAVKRVCCELYWRKQIRRAQVQKRETQERERGNICARVMPYCHDVTVARYAQRQDANRAMMEQTEIESADGETITLWDAAQAGTSNKSIRRGELMTRIRGCEEWALARDMVGIFTTNTTPSRFHASNVEGGRNRHFDGSTPIDGQEWLSETWARARAKIQRQKIKVFGFRVAEPHHDGTPHWHMLMWVNRAQVEQLVALMRDCWLQCEGTEWGAAEHRFKAVAIEQASGGAVAYVAKYIAKSIDDAGTIGDEGHDDERNGQKVRMQHATAKRVTAWASAWGIRQFQAIGQPPVTVWRELRRVDAAMAAGASQRLQRAHAAVHKEGEKRADWSAYMVEQGGAMVGHAYQLRLKFDTEEKEGRYGLVESKSPAGVYDIARPGELCTSKRKKWKPRGTWTPAERHNAKVGTWGELAVLAVLDPTWTRFNNCTEVIHGRTRKREKSSAGRNPAQHRTGRPGDSEPPIFGQAARAGVAVMDSGRQR